MAAKKKKASKAKQAKKLTSQIKLANKEASKIAQRRRKHKKLKSRLRRVDNPEKDKVKHLPKPVTAIVEEEVERDLEDDDISFYSTPGQSVRFASTVRDSILSNKSDSKEKKRKKKSDDTEAEDFERLPRKLFARTDKDRKMILPIKTKNGMIKERFIEDAENEEDEVPEETNTEESHDQQADQSDEEPLPELSPLELYAYRQDKLRKRRNKIAALCGAITENPQENISKLGDLLQVTAEKDVDLFVTVRKLGMVSLLEVFKDIIPGYHIRSLTETEKSQKMKKETIALTNFEQTLLKYYREYLVFLHKTAKEQGSKENDIPHTAKQGLKELAVKCLCDLVIEHSHFNYREDIFSVIVDFMDSKVEKLSDMTCDCVKRLFRGDKAGNVTLLLTRAIGKMIKNKDFHVQPKVLDTFLSLRIKEVSYTDPIAKIEEEKKKANIDKMSRKDRKRRKYMTLLEKDMKETVATEDRRKRLKLHTETIQAVFLTYFRILKKAPESNLLPSVLEGLAKFAHLISIDFFNDLFAVLSELIESETLSYRGSLHCVQTAFTILTGQGSVLNIDPIMFYRHFYRSLFHVHSGTTSCDIPTVLTSLDVMISRRKRQVSQQRILAFIKRLCIISLQQLPSGCVGLLAAVRSLFLTYRYADVLLDNETSGSGMYLQELDDPEHCNAHNTALWEISLLQHHFDPMVRKFATHLGKGAPTQGEGQLNTDLRKPPLTLYEMIEKKDIFTKELPEKAARKSKYKFRRPHFLQEDLQSEIERTLQTVADCPQQFFIDMKHAAIST